MSERRIPYDDEINLFDYFDILCDGKWKILAITLATTLIGTAFSLYKPKTNDILTIVSPSHSYNFTKYASLNDVLDENSLSHEVDRENTFDLFISEFNNYEDVANVLMEHSYIINLLKDVDAEKRLQVLIETLKKSLIITNKESINKPEWVIKLVWYDIDEGRTMLAIYIESVLANVHKAIIEDLKLLANSLQSKRLRQIKYLKAKLSVIEKTRKAKTDKRLLFLREQGAIARELGIENNTLDRSGLALSQGKSVSLSVSSRDIPFYLRGYKAIDKEYNLLVERTDEEKLLMTEDYINTKKKLAEINNDVSVRILLSNMEVLLSDNAKAWIHHDMGFVDIELNNVLSLYITLSLVLGGMVGTFYVFFTKALRNRKEKLADS